MLSLQSTVGQTKNFQAKRTNSHNIWSAILNLLQACAERPEVRDLWTSNWYRPEPLFRGAGQKERGSGDENERNQDKLEKLNERALRFTFDDKSSTYDKLLQKIHMPSLANRRKQDDCITVYKALNNLAPKYIHELLNQRIIPKKKLRGINKLHVPKVHPTTYGLSSFRYDAAYHLHTVLMNFETLCMSKTFCGEINHIPFFVLFLSDEKIPPNRPFSAILNTKKSS